LMKKNHMIPEVLPEKYLFDNIEECAEWLKGYYSEKELQIKK